MNIDIPPNIVQIKSDLKTLNSLKKSVGETLSTKRCSDIENATQLAVYLFVLGDVEKAAQLLRCFYAKVECDYNNTTLWFEYGCSVVLLAELHQNRSEEIGCFLKPIIENDIVEGSRIEYYVDHSEHEYAEALSTAELESQKYQCGIYTSEILILLYFKHMLRYEDEHYFQSVKADIESKLVKVKAYLQNSLVKRRTTNIDRISEHPQD